LKIDEVGYKELANLLIEGGAPETEAAVTSKIVHGASSAAFMLSAERLLDVTR
jgi:hypothetical protein